MADKNKDRQFCLGIDRFHEHMKTKAEFWKPEVLTLGADYAVFEFGFQYEHDRSWDGAMAWIDSYGYDIWSDGCNRFVIRNRPKGD